MSRLAFVTACAFAATAAASAQTTVPVSVASSEGAEAAGTAAGETADSTDGGDILVTARRREERAQDVPIALSVVGERQLAATGNFTISQVQQLVPSLQVFGSNARNTNINIRGLGSNALSNDGLETGVGFYVDGVYYGRVGQSQFDLVDLDRIEVLRGPQGTLFGKNTTAGAINITTRLPSFTPEFYGEASIGDHGYYQLRGSGSAPLIADKLALRLSLAQTQRNGFVRNVFTGRKDNDYENFTSRAQLLFTPSESLTFRLIGDYSRQKQRALLNSQIAAFSTYDNGATIANNFLLRSARLGYKPVLGDPFDRRADADARYQANMKSYGVSGEVNWDLGNAAITSITAARWWDWYPLNDQDFTSLPINPTGGTLNHQRQFSEELRLASTGKNTIDYVLGAFYFYQKVKGFGSYSLGPAAAAWNNPAVDPVVANAALNGFRSDSDIVPVTRSYAAFGQATWNISDALKFTGGLRFTHEKKTGLFDQRTVAGADLSGLTAAQRATAQSLRNALYPVVRYTTGLKDDSLSGLATLSYKVAPDATIYATYQRGGKSGGLSLGVLPAGVSAAVKQEKVDSYEVGVKSQLFDRKVTFNIAAYWQDVRDYQTAIVEFIANSTSSIRYIANIPSVRSRGIEGDLVWAPTRLVSFNAAAAYNDAEYREYRNAPNAPENLNISPLQDLSGKRLSGAPKFTYTLGADVAQPVGGFGDAELQAYGHADFSHRSSYYAVPTNSRYGLIDSFGILNARSGLRTDDGRWDVSVWARNLTDNNYFTSLAVANYGLVTGLLGDPRTVGATLRTRF
ncbi:MAG: TonB-dependent receptor [Rhizorhabdus sp.]